jgi:hypothetical protein
VPTALETRRAGPHGLDWQTVRRFDYCMQNYGIAPPSRGFRIAK